MDALEELRRNRDARMNHIQKGFASEEIDIQKAQVGERRTFQGKEYVWTEFAPGKFGWRRPKDGQAAAPQPAPQPKQAAPKQEPAKQEGKTDDKGGESHEHEYKIEDAEKYVDKSNASSAEKKVAKYILLGKSEKEIKQMMTRAKVDSGVIDYVYKLGKKLASEAEDEAKRIHKENNWKSYGGGYTMEHAKKLAGEWGISVEEAKDAFSKFEQEFGGQVEWSKDEKYVFSQPDSGTKYKFDPDDETWEKIEEKKQAKSAPPAPEPDFTPKIPSEIARLTNRSDWEDFDTAYRTLGAAIVKEKYPTPADVQKYIQDNHWSGINTQADMERRLGREEAGDYIAVTGRGKKSYNKQPLSKTAQIAAMKKYYENKAERDKKAYQEKKNIDYWAGEGAKRKAEIMKRRDELKDQITRNIDGAKKAIQSLVATSVPDGPFKSKMIPTEVSLVVNYNDEHITIQETTDTGNRYNSGIEITITHGDFWAKPGDKGYDAVGTAEISMSSMRTKEAESANWEHERNKMMLANTTMGQIGSIKKTLAGYVSGIRDARDEMEKLVEELTKNH